MTSILDIYTRPDKDDPVTQTLLQMQRAQEEKVEESTPSPPEKRVSPKPGDEPGEPRVLTEQTEEPRQATRRALEEGEEPKKPRVSTEQTEEPDSVTRKQADGAEEPEQSPKQSIETEEEPGEPRVLTEQTEEPVQITRSAPDSIEEPSVTRSAPLPASEKVEMPRMVEPDDEMAPVQELERRVRRLEDQFAKKDRREDSFLVGNSDALKQV